ncbi:hypothetical protein HYR99_21540 [Candidatus Poribacteria bacterium]|nr:hypothetical protein [Candidatus Poribacteria bacterium]
MKNMIVIPNVQFSKDSIMELVESWGGYWVKESGLDHGVIDRNKSHIYVAYCDDVSQEYEPDEINTLSERSGDMPNILIDIHIGWAEGSDKLAKDFANIILEKWGGFVDDGMEELC